jgi:coenzyme F420-reducing hydrogenase beta subunit
MKTQLVGFAVVLALGGAVTARAQEDFEKRKAEAVAGIDERIQKLQEHKACVSGASTPEALKQCRGSMKEWQQGQRLEHMEKNKARIEERMQKLKSKKDASSGQ